MKLLLVILVLVSGLIALVKSSSNNYSPMDSYANAVVKEAKDSTRAANEAKPYVDSLYSTYNK